MRWVPPALPLPLPRGDLKAIDVHDSDGAHSVCLPWWSQPLVDLLQEPVEEPCVQGLGQGIPADIIK